ncbi:MAG: tetratricopeptide repeat protein [Gemmatimonadetes bacterium]|nr:tetratricopeptide repeat protein [Gemmatimonadota bacterium]NIO30162.1 tetratricopeptide repeat protein [Gemmatimonadota bacterium]
MKALGAFFSELKRRRVYRVAVVYAAVAFVIWQAAEIAFPALNLPDWALTLVVVLTLAGFPIAVVFAWAFDITPEGVRRTTPAAASPAVMVRSAVRARRLAAAAAVVVLVIVAAWWIWGRRPSPASQLSPNRIAVFPFAVRGGEDLLYLHEGMVHLLSSALDGAGELRTVDPHALLSGLSLDEGDAPDPGTAAAVAARYGAGLYVLGSVVGSAERIEVTASLYGAPRGARTTAEAVPGRETDIQDLVDELARGLVADLAGRPGDRLASLAARTTRSIPALKAYLAGHRALHRGDMLGAIEAFENSLALDSAFVLARYELALTAAWEGHGVPARQAVVRAVQDSASLPARERRLLVGLDAFLRGDLQRAADSYRRVLGEYPDELEANYMLGETLFHLSSTHGQSMQRARAPFERVLNVDPDHLYSLHHLAVLALMRGEYVVADSLIERALATEPERWLVVCLRTNRAMASGDPDLRTAVQNDLPTVENLGLFCSMMTSTWIFKDPADARWVVEALTAPHRATQLRAAGHALLAYYEAARGRPSQVDRELVEVDRLYPLGASHRAYLSLLPLAPSDRSMLEERLREVEAWDVASLPTSTTALMIPPVEVQPAIRLYLLGALSARLGRDSAALAYADRLEQLELAGGGDLSATLAPGIRAALAAAHGELEEALRLLETAPFRGHYEEVYTSPVISMAAERYLMAELLDAAGRSREALGWLASLGDLQAYEIAYVAPAHLRRAQIHERLGEPEQAAEHYARFIELWRECDPELRPLVEDAEARLAQLREQT